MSQNAPRLLLPAQPAPQPVTGQSPVSAKAFLKSLLPGLWRPPGAMPEAKALYGGPSPAQPAGSHTQSGLPAQPGGLRKPWKGILPESLSGGTVFSVSCIPCPSPVNGVLPAACCGFFVLNTIPLRSKLTANAFFTPPSTAGGCCSKAAKTGGRRRPSACSLPAPLLRQKPLDRKEGAVLY